MRHRAPQSLCNAADPAVRTGRVLVTKKADMHSTAVRSRVPLAKGHDKICTATRIFPGKNVVDSPPQRAHSDTGILDVRVSLQKDLLGRREVGFTKSVRAEPGFSPERSVLRGRGHMNINQLPYDSRRKR